MEQPAEHFLPYLDLGETGLRAREPPVGWGAEALEGCGDGVGECLPRWSTLFEFHRHGRQRPAGMLTPIAQWVLTWTVVVLSGLLC